MSLVAAWVAVLFALLTVWSALVAAQLRLSDEDAHKAESIDFLRLSFTGIFGVLTGQALVPTALNWWLVSLSSFLLMLALLACSQLTARLLSGKPVGRFLLKSSRPFVRSVSLLFTPLATPKQEAFEEFEQELHESVEEFGETIVREVMVPRIDMVTIASELNLEKAMTVFLACGHSRLPVVGKSVDDILGVIYIKDVARVAHEKPASMNQRTVTEVMRKAIFVPESKPVDDLLREMQNSATHMAIIIDEYGGVAGLATMEDVIEEIVGEIADEYDRGTEDVEQLSDGSYRVNARYPLFDLGEILGIELEDEDVDSVGGLVAKLVGRLPKVGDSVQFSGLTMTADRIEGRRKRLVSVLVTKAPDLEDATAAFAEDLATPKESKE